MTPPPTPPTPPARSSDPAPPTPPVPSTPPTPPASALRALLPPDVDLDDRLRHPEARWVWLGMVWGRLGRGDHAEAHFARVRASELQPWIAAERGRLLRELGHHADAEGLEAPALHDAVDPVDAAMLRISLTADAVGHGDIATATSRLRDARAAVANLADGPRARRQRLRLSWVEVEVAWLRGEDPPTAALPAWSEGFGGPRLPADYAAGTTFHAAKGLLFAGVVRGDLRLLDAALREAPPVLRWAIHEARADAGVIGARVPAQKARATIVAPYDPPGAALGDPSTST